MYFEQQVHSSLPELLEHVVFVGGEDVSGAAVAGASSGEGAAEKVRQLKAELQGMGLDKEKLATEMELVEKIVQRLIEIVRVNKDHWTPISHTQFDSIEIYSKNLKY